MRSARFTGPAVILALAGFGVMALLGTATAQPAPAAAAKGPTRAVAVLIPTKGNTVAGTIWFDATDKGVHIHGTITGLTVRRAHCGRGCAAERRAECCWSVTPPGMSTR